MIYIQKQFPQELQNLLAEVSTNVQNIGRKIGSPRNTSNDLLILTDALFDSADTLGRINRMISNDEDTTSQGIHPS